MVVYVGPTTAKEVDDLGVKAMAFNAHGFKGHAK